MIIRKGRSTVTFVFSPGQGARTVAVVGSFNGWDPARGRMRRQRDGTFRRRETLPPRRYVDGRWCVDPDGEGRVPNPYGTENSMVAVG